MHCCKPFSSVSESVSWNIFYLFSLSAFLACVASLCRLYSGVGFPPRSHTSAATLVFDGNLVFSPLKPRRFSLSLAPALGGLRTRLGSAQPGRSLSLRLACAAGAQWRCAGGRESALRAAAAPPPPSAPRAACLPAPAGPAARRAAPAAASRERAREGEGPGPSSLPSVPVAPAKPRPSPGQAPAWWRRWRPTPE